MGTMETTPPMRTREIIKTEPYQFEEDNDTVFVEDVELPTKRRRLSEELTTSAAHSSSTKSSKIWDDFEKLLKNCARKEIKKSIDKVQKTCTDKDQSAWYIALLNESPYTGINISKAIGDLGLKLKKDIEGARKTLESEIQQSLSRNMQQEFEWASVNGDFSDDD
jgi:ElaB/YqjD/DUF883 family membrane-anchored ribosome-binding protein